MVKKNVLFFGILAIIISLFSVSCSSGKTDTELKQIVSQAIQGIDALEKENASLKAKLAKPTKGSITRDIAAAKEDLIKSQDENSALKTEVEKLTGVIAHTKSAIEANEKEYSAQVTALQQEISKLKGMLSFSRLQLETKQEEENARITELEKSNSELNDVLKKVHTITQEQQPVPVAKPKQ